MLISVLGTGYLGATHAACLAASGHDVIGVDRSAERVSTLRSGRAPFHENGLDELLAEGVAAGRLRFTGDIAEAAGAEVHFLCVGTPQSGDGGHADLTALWSVVDALAPLLDEPCLVVGKSTVPVGTAAQVREQAHRLAPAGSAVSVAWNPEFLREGRAVQDTLRPDRLVLGVESPADQQQLLRVYADLVAAGVPVITTDLATAELAKVSANAMLATRISTVNLLAEVCEASGADVGDLTTILGADPRIGRDFLTPGLGYGGGCLPKDTRAFVARARELGVGESTALLEAVDRVNAHQRERATAMALSLLDGDGAGPGTGTGGPGVVAVLGGAFKAESDDVRDSPALDVAGRLHDAGVELRLHDPHAGDNVRRERPDLRVVDTVADACAGADLVLVATEWAQFAAIDPDELGEVVARRTVLDTRQVLSPDKWIAAGWDFHALGRGA